MRYGIAKIIARAIRELPPEQGSEWAELYHGHRGDPFLLRAGWTPEQRAAILAAVSSWVRRTRDSYLAVKSVANWSPRFGAALALQSVASTVDLWQGSSRLGHRMVDVAGALLWSPDSSKTRVAECSALLSECNSMRFSTIRNKHAFSSFWHLGTAMVCLSTADAKGWHLATIDSVGDCACSMADLRWGSICPPYDSEWVAERELQLERLGGLLAESLLTGDLAERLG